MNSGNEWRHLEEYTCAYLANSSMKHPRGPTAIFNDRLGGPPAALVDDGVVQELLKNFKGKFVEKRARQRNENGKHTIS